MDSLCSPLILVLLLDDLLDLLLLVLLSYWSLVSIWSCFYDDDADDDHCFDGRRCCCLPTLAHHQRRPLAVLCWLAGWLAVLSLGAMSDGAISYATACGLSRRQQQQQQQEQQRQQWNTVAQTLIQLARSCA